MGVAQPHRKSDVSKPSHFLCIAQCWIFAECLTGNSIGEAVTIIANWGWMMSQFLSGPRVFISYSSKDSIFALRISEDLEREGIIPWLAEKELMPGNIHQAILEAIALADYFLVLISKNNLKSDCVAKEITVAISKGESAQSNRVIIAKLDESELPEPLHEEQYVDLHSDYDNGTKELITLFNQKLPEDAIAIKDVIDSDDLAEEIEKEQKEIKGSGSFLTIYLAVLAIIVAGISAIPSFSQAFGNLPHIYYAKSLYSIDTPPNTDAKLFYQVLSENNIAESSIRIDIINKGTVAAKKIKLGIQLSNSIQYTKSIPPSTPSPVWVSIEIESKTVNDKKYYTYIYEDLVPEKLVSVVIGYNAVDGLIPEVDVVYDGKFAEEVASIKTVPTWSYWQLFKFPLQILFIGLFLSSVVGIVFKLMKYPKFRTALLSIIEEQNPLIASLVNLSLKSFRQFTL